MATHGLFSGPGRRVTKSPRFSNEKVAEAVHAGRAEVGFGLRMNARGPWAGLRCR
ncbi:hypothetical protein ACU4GD_42115 [Cupriavidus basilensis]